MGGITQSLKYNALRRRQLNAEAGQACECNGAIEWPLTACRVHHHVGREAQCHKIAGCLNDANVRLQMKRVCSNFYDSS